jgi:hypothetical protein
MSLDISSFRIGRIQFEHGTANHHFQALSVPMDYYDTISTPPLNINAMQAYLLDKQGMKERRNEGRTTPRPVAIETLRTHFSNIGTWRWSSVGPRRGRRVAPITARTDRDSRAVRGTKMRWVFER